jgi:hypothetical protein
VEKPPDAGLGAGRQFAVQFRPGRAEAGPTVEVRDLAKVSGVVGLGLIA